MDENDKEYLTILKKIAAGQDEEARMEYWENLTELIKTGRVGKDFALNVATLLEGSVVFPYSDIIFNTFILGMLQYKAYTLEGLRQFRKFLKNKKKLGGLREKAIDITINKNQKQITQILQQFEEVEIIDEEW